MKAVEFAYWLQGYFEITGGEEPLTTAQAGNIRAKIQKIDQKAASAVEQQALGMVSYVDAALVVALDSGNPEALAAATIRIRTKLNDLFVHAVDPSYQGDQNHFGDLHGGDSQPSSFRPKPGMRC